MESGMLADMEVDKVADMTCKVYPTCVSFKLCEFI